MKKEFLPYELALKLKDLGFDEPCFATYMKHATNIPEGAKYSDYNLDYPTKVQMDWHVEPRNSLFVNDWVAAPLWQQAQAWLREKHRISVVVTHEYKVTTDWMFFGYVIEPNIRNYSLNDVIKYDRVETDYEAALEKGLYEALKLIK